MSTLADTKGSDENIRQSPEEELTVDDNSIAEESNVDDSNDNDDSSFNESNDDDSSLNESSDDEETLLPRLNTVDDNNEYFESSIELGMHHTAKLCLTFAEWLRATSIYIANSEQGQSIGISVLWTASKAWVYLERFGAHIYNSNKHVKSGVDLALWCKDSVSRFTETRRRESDAANWLHTCRLIKQTNGKSPYYEIYTTLPNGEHHTNKERLFSDVYNSVEQYHDTCMMMKTDGLYFVTTCDDAFTSIPNPLQKIKSPPLSITYEHPSMDVKIEFDLPDEMFCEGNILFTQAFVYRCLEYQGVDFVFDENYKISIIDGNVDVHTLSSNDSLRVIESGVEKREQINNDE